MNIRLFIALLLLAAAAASALPIAAASTTPGPAPGATDDGSALGAADDDDSAPRAADDDGSAPRAADDDGSASMRAAELRVFALYGPREFSTFPVVPAGLWAAGETAPRGAPLDRQPEDPWLGVDKAKHVAFSFLWTLGTQYVAVNKGRFSEAQALPISAGTSAAVGLSKEYYDLRMGPTQFFSYKDLVADGVGILLAVGVILL